MNLRPHEITQEFHRLIEQNLQELVEGKTEEYLDIHKIASLLFIHPTHLSNTIKETTGKSPCAICNEKTIEVAKDLLKNSELTIANVAEKLTYEPTNFTKYFKKHTGMTPTQYRNSIPVLP